jgi:hypothetical protein
MKIEFLGYCSNMVSSVEGLYRVYQGEKRLGLVHIIASSLQHVENTDDWSPRDSFNDILWLFKQESAKPIAWEFSNNFPDEYKELAKLLIETMFRKDRFVSKILSRTQQTPDS